MGTTFMSAHRVKLFRNSALTSGLVTSEQLDQAMVVLRVALADEAGPPLEITEDALAERLIEMGVITSYQADQLKEGRTKLDLGPYIITDWIGQGGMGQVFKAVHAMMGREVAIKVLPLSRSTPEAIASFTREIRTQAQLDHPKLVRAYDAGHDGNVYYLVTEFVPGTDLRRLVRQRGPLTMQQAAAVIRQAAQGLDYAHQRGFIHRDVKPGNILVTPDNVAKVSDLGLAACMTDGENDPRAGRIVGTADYLAPEQIKTPLQVTSAADMYSLGCTLYYAVTGKVPFPGGTTKDKARRHCEETPWHPRRFNTDLSEEFVEVIADMMEKDPRSRLAKGSDVVARLEPWASEASPIATQQLSRSAWVPPPIPGAAGERPPSDADTLATDDDGGANESASGYSHPPDTLAGSNQETTADSKRRNAAPAIPQPQPALLGSAPSFSLATLVTALAIAVPLSMLAGAIAMFLFMSLAR